MVKVDLDKRMAHIPQPPGRSPFRFGCTLRLIILAAIAVTVFRYIVAPLFESGFGLYITDPVPGDERNFDPIAALPAVVAYAGEGAQLTQISFQYVRLNGTLNLHADYTPYVNYEFVREVPRPENAPPIGVGGANTGPWYEEITVRIRTPGQWFTYHEISGNSETTVSYLHKGMRRDVSAPRTISPQITPLPACSLAALWQAALARELITVDAANAVAIIRYTEGGYRFSISGTGINLRFDEDCKLVSP